MNYQADFSPDGNVACRWSHYNWLRISFVFRELTGLAACEYVTYFVW